MIIDGNKVYEGEQELKKIDSILFRMKKDMKRRPVFELTQDERDLARHLFWRKKYVRLQIEQEKLGLDLDNETKTANFTLLDNKRKELSKQSRIAYRMMNLIRPKFTITKYF